MKKNLLLVILLLSISTSSFPQQFLALVRSVETGKWGYVDNTGNMIIPAIYSKGHEFSNSGMAPVYVKSRYTFINTKGELLKTDLIFTLISASAGYDIVGYNDGYVPVRIGSKYGYMDMDGKLAVPAKYSDLVQFNGGYGVGRLDKQLVVINEKGEEFPIEGASEAKHFSEGLAPYRDKKSEYYGFIGADGKPVITAQFKTVGYFSGGLAWARVESGKIGFINSKGEWVLKPQFDVVNNFNPESDIARIKMGNEWGYVNTKGEAFFPKDTDTYGDFNNGLALGKQRGLVGFFDFKGKWIIDPTFAGARGFKNGYAAVKMGDKWGFIDTKGDWVIDPIFDNAKDMELIK